METTTEKMKYTIQDLRDRKMIIFEGISGSTAYGTSTPESDIDIRGVFIQSLEDVLRYGFIEQVSDEKNDITFYEIGRFIEFLIGNNPNILELINLPEDCVIYRHPMFKLIEQHKNVFLTKKVRWTFAQYAICQIQKSRGYNKKMNWEEHQMIRKTVLDFCYVIDANDSIPFKEWIEKLTGFTQKNYSLSNIDHVKDLYAMYFFKGGIVSDEETANDVQLISIPKFTYFVGNLFFNKDAYSNHCRLYKEYQTWLKERNPNRFKMNKEHGKNYDSKNMCHTYRLLLMAHEMAKGELRIRRTPEEIEKLMKIRRGEYEYEDLLKEAEEMISTLDAAFEKSDIPEKVDTEFAYDILGKLRSAFYL